MRQTETATNNQLVFSNYNYAYSYFSKKYKDVILSLSQTRNIREINKAVCTFVYEISHALELKDDWKWYDEKLDEINRKFREDSGFLNICEKETLDKEEEMQGLPKYYEYFLSFMEIFTSFIGELTAVFLPYSTLQERRVAFKNDNPFYERFYEMKDEVHEKLKNFRFRDFHETFNLMVIYYHAYSIFITKEDIEFIERKLSGAISLYLHPHCLNLILEEEELSRKQLKELLKYEWEVYRALQECNRALNQSFSDYNLNVKPQERVYIDKTGI